MKARERKGRRRERERRLFSAMLRALQKHIVSLSLVRATPPPPSSFSSSSRYLFSLSRRVQPLRTARTPPRANTGQRLLRVYHRLPSIFTIFTSRPRDPTAYNQTSRTEEKGTWDALPTFPSIFASTPRPSALSLF